MYIYIYIYIYIYKFQNIKAYLKPSDRSSRSQMFFKTNVLKHFAIFEGKHLCWTLFLRVSGFQAFNFIKKRLQQRCFPVNTAEFLRTVF